MEKLVVSTFVERVWYLRRPGSKDTIKKTLTDWLIRDAQAQGVDIDLSSIAIEEEIIKRRGCEDNMRITAVASILSSSNEIDTEVPEE
jgi:hypothetical protein